MHQLHYDKCYVATATQTVWVHLVLTIFTGKLVLLLFAIAMYAFYTSSYTCMLLHTNTF